MLERSIHRCPNRWVAGVAIAAALTLTACGNVTPGGLSRVDVAVSGDAPDGTAVTAPIHEAPSVPAASGPGSDGSGDEPEGEIEVEFDLHLVSLDGAVTKLNDDEVRVRVDLRGRDEVEAVRRFVEATSYAELRITFTEIRAEVESGLVINGVPVVGEIRVELEDLSLEISHPLGLDLSDGSRAELLIDLNAAAWLQAVDPETRTVDPSVFAALIDMVVR